MPELKIPAPALSLLRPLAVKAEDLKFSLFLVGGAVRDWILGAKTCDLDLVMETDPTPVAQLCGRILQAKPQAFGRFGTLRVLGGGWRVDFATSRKESYLKPASLPLVRPAPIEEDLFRRDFTVNAMALRLYPERAGELIDPYGGLKDLRAGVLRVMHPASFRDDPTRVFRAARYLCRFGFRPAAGLVGMARGALKAGHAGLLSRHRLAQELLRILAEKDPACALDRLRGWGYLQLIHPGLTWPKRSPTGVEGRLGALALALGPGDGEKFVRSLPLEHGMSSRLIETLKIVREKASPRSPLASAALSVLSCAYPRLARSALRPLFVNGDDLKALGITPGMAYREILEAAAKAQWAGRISSRQEALRWLRRFARR